MLGDPSPDHMRKQDIATARCPRCNGQTLERHRLAFLCGILVYPMPNGDRWGCWSECGTVLYLRTAVWAEAC